MNIKLEPIDAGEAFSGTVTTPETALTQRDALTEASATLTAIANQEELETGVAYLRDVGEMLKITEKSRKEHKQPFWDFGVMIDAFAAKFSAPLEKEKNRLSGLVNHYQRQQLEDKRIADAKAAKEAADAKRAAEEAAKAIADAEKKNDAGALLEAQLQLEEAAMTAKAASTVLAAPTNTPKGLVTKVRYDFQITDPLKFVAAAHRFIKFQDDNETLKVDRTAILKAINHDTDPTWLPPEGQDSITHPFGIRIFRDIKSHVR